jgi:hypothetical protein
MQTGLISFCDKTAFNIKTQNVKENILKDIYDTSKFKIIQKHFELLKKHHFSKLNDNPHLISLKSNGNPYLLYLTKFNFINTSIFIDKKVQSGYFLPRMIITRFSFPDELFDNTLIEGEMIKDNNGKWIFIINDIYISKNICLQNKNILKRLDILYDIFKDFKNESEDVCLFQINKYFTYEKFQYLIDDYKKSLNYTCRGIYFKPLFFKFKNILYNFDDSLICKVNRVKYQKKNEFISDIQFNKNFNTNINTNTNNTESNTNINTNTNNTKSNTNINTNTNNTKSNTNTKILFIENTELPDVYNLYKYNLDEKNFTILPDIAYIKNIESSIYIKDLFINKPIKTKIKMECTFIDKFNKWFPIKRIQ